VFARDAAGALSTASGLTVTLPAAITVTPVDVTGTVTQLVTDAPLTDSGSLAFTAYQVSNTRIAAVLPASGVIGKLTRTVTEPKGSAPGAVAWTYTVANADVRFLGEGEKRDEVFVIELRDNADKVPTTVTVSVLGINDAPVATGQPGQVAIAGSAFSYPIPAEAFTDPDASDALTYSTGALPAWLSLSGSTLSGTPAAGDVGSLTVTVTATDPHGASVSGDVVIDVSPAMPAPNQPPVPADDQVAFDMAADPLQASVDVLANDTDPDSGPNPLAVIPASGEWQVNGEVAGSYTIDAAGALVLDSGVSAEGPLQRLAAGEQAAGAIQYSVTDGADTVTAQVTITATGADASAARYDVTKVLVPPVPEPGRALGSRHGIG
jgi:VCBS repeat-containing protein